MSDFPVRLTLKRPELKDAKKESSEVSERNRIAVMIPVQNYIQIIQTYSTCSRDRLTPANALMKISFTRVKMLLVEQIIPQHQILAFAKSKNLPFTFQHDNLHFNTFFRSSLQIYGHIDEQKNHHCNKQRKKTR